MFLDQYMYSNGSLDVKQMRSPCNILLRRDDNSGHSLPFKKPARLIARLGSVTRSHKNFSSSCSKTSIPRLVPRPDRLLTVTEVQWAGRLFGRYDWILTARAPEQCVGRDWDDLE